MNFNTSLLKTKTTTNTQGVQAFTAKKGRSVTTVGTTEEILAPASPPRSSPRRACLLPVPS